MPSPRTETPKQNQNRDEMLRDLRRLLPRLEGFRDGGHVLPFGLPTLDTCLPQGGLVLGALHEIVPEAPADIPAAFSFISALLGRMPQSGPVLLVASLQGFASYGRPYGHGLNVFGLDPARVILVETTDERQALWAIEEALRSRVPQAVVGAIGAGLDLKASQRLQLAARVSEAPFLLLRPAGASGSSAAVTRWCIGAAEAARDRFGLIARWRWHVQLERCRNGRLGEWLVEFDHVAHRFGLASAVANCAFHGSPVTQLVRAGADRS